MMTPVADYQKRAMLRSFYGEIEDVPKIACSRCVNGIMVPFFRALSVNQTSLVMTPARAQRLQLIQRLVQLRTY